MGKPDNNIKSGSHSTNVIGDGNEVVTYITKSASTAIRRSYLYEVCKELLDADIKPSDDYSLKTPSEWTEKLDYNSVSPNYVEILTADQHAYDVIEEVMISFKNRDVLIKKVNYLYHVADAEREKTTKDADFVLDNVFRALCDALKDHEDGLTERLPDEERERCVWLIMFYAFTKCKILKKPPTRTEV